MPLLARGDRGDHRGIEVAGVGPRAIACQTGHRRVSARSAARALGVRTRGKGGLASKASGPAAHDKPVTTVVVSTEDSRKYCDGLTMDSDGYRKTITQEKAVTLPATVHGQAETIRAVAMAAVAGRSCETALKDLDFKLEGG